VSSVGGVGRAERRGEASEPERAERAPAPAAAQVVRGSSPVRAPRPRPAGEQPGPTSWLTSDAERRAFEAACKHVGGADVKAAVTSLLDALEALSPASFNRVLHALAAAADPDPVAPSLLDKLIFRATGRQVDAPLTRRFLHQLETKLAGQPGRVLDRAAEQSRARLAAGSRRLGELLA
jgi:hypothetical protein